MIQMAGQKQRRRWGIVLTLQGLRKLQAAQSEAEYQETCANCYTLVASSNCNGFLHTLIKERRREAGVDQQTFKCCFSIKTKPAPETLDLAQMFRFEKLGFVRGGHNRLRQSSEH